MTADMEAQHYGIIAGLLLVGGVAILIFATGGNISLPTFDVFRLKTPAGELEAEGISEASAVGLTVAFGIMLISAPFIYKAVIESRK